MGIMDQMRVMETEREAGVMTGASGTQAESGRFEPMLDVFARLANERWECLAAQIVGSFALLQDDEQGNLLWDVIARQSVPSLRGNRMEAWARDYPNGDGRWVPLADTSIIQWEAVRDRQGVTLIMSAFRTYSDMRNGSRYRDAAGEPVVFCRMVGVGLFAVEECFRAALENLAQE